MQQMHHMYMQHMHQMQQHGGAYQYNGAGGMYNMSFPPSPVGMSEASASASFGHFANGAQARARPGFYASQSRVGQNAGTGSAHYDVESRAYAAAAATSDRSDQRCVELCGLSAKKRLQLVTFPNLVARVNKKGLRKALPLSYSGDASALQEASRRRIRELLDCQGRAVTDDVLSAMESFFQDLLIWMEEQNFDSLLEAAETHFGSKHLQTLIKQEGPKRVTLIDTLLLG